MSFLWVGFGGVIGALLRFQISKSMSKRWAVSFPLATLVINCTGCFLLGWFTRNLGKWWPNLGTVPMLLLGVGVCGAYTTFSTFSYELTILLREGRWRTALLYFTSSFMLCFAASGAGLYGIPML